MIDQYGKEKAEELLSSEKLRNSYAGQFGRTIEPVIAPLGFDWKIGIALITSFAAREVFVGTMATIYGAGNADETSETLRSRMLSDTNERTGLPLFTLATSLALMIFYAFAMQCMSTIAVVYRETGGWKWPLIQLAYLSTLAWVSAYIVYTLFS
jgi:ferrous iron transport protein B